MQSIPLAVLKLFNARLKIVGKQLHAIHTACGIFLFSAAFFQTADFFMA